MAISDDEREKLRTAWSGYCDAVKTVVDEAIDGKLGDARDGDELAELLRSVGRIAAMSLQHRFDFNDPDFPLFLRQMDDRYRYGGPDNNIAYFMATLRGDASYREGLDVLIDALRRSDRRELIAPRFTSIVVDTLAARLASQAGWNANPDVLKSSVTAPLMNGRRARKTS